MLTAARSRFRATEGTRKGQAPHHDRAPEKHGLAVVSIDYRYAQPPYRLSLPQSPLTRPPTSPPAEALPTIAGIVLFGVAYNGGFLVLISVWGPLVASVGNLCTLLLVAVADTVVVGVPLTWPTVGGSGLVVAAFAGLIVGAKREKEVQERAGLADVA